MSFQPHVIFVPSAWHKPEVYAALTIDLQLAGYRVTGVTTPSVVGYGKEPMPDFGADVEAIRSAIKGAVDAGDKGFEKDVYRMIYLCALAVPVGKSLIDMLEGGTPLDWIISEGDSHKAIKNKEIFYNDISEEEAETHAAKLFLHSPGSLSSKVTFWPSGVYRSFGDFCASQFIVGAGLSTLDTAADPFLSICGPPRYSEIRLNLAQAVQGTGSFVAPLLASRVFFASVGDNPAALKNVQWTYLGMAGFVAVLIILFLLAPLPEPTDADMATQEVDIANYDPGPLKRQYNLFLGVSSQFCYVGAQVAIAGYFINFAEEAGKNPSQSSNLLAVAQGLYASNRFLAGALMTMPFFKPRYMLLTYLGLCIVFSIAAMNTTSDVSIAMFIVIFCFESCCFATIFTLALRGLGRHTKLGGSFLVAAISGGAVFPPAMGAVVTRSGAHYAMFVPMIGYIMAWIFPLYVNFFDSQKMDERRNTKLNTTEADKVDHALGAAAMPVDFKGEEAQGKLSFSTVECVESSI